MTLDDLAWPLENIADAIGTLARAAGMATHQGQFEAGLGIERAAASLGLEVEPVTVPYAEVAALLRGIGPGLLRLPSGRWLAVLRRRRSRLVVLTSGSTEELVPIDALKRELTATFEQDIDSELERMLSSSRITGPRRLRVKRWLLRSRLAARPVSGGWLVRAAPGASFVRELVRAGVTRHCMLFFLAHLGRQLTALLAWWWIGRAALEGRFDAGALVGWALLLATQFGLGLISTRCQALAAIDGGSMLKRRLLAGATGLDVDAMKAQGVGSLIGRVLEAESIEALALGAGLAAVCALIELALALAILAGGALGGWHAVLLGCWLALGLLAARRYHRWRARWTKARVDLTHGLCERMLGHRTRLSQERVARWHEGEDEALERYFHDARALDHAASSGLTMLARGWLLVGMAALAPTLVALDAPTGALAVALGGVLFAFRALRKLASGLAGLSAAILACENVATLFRAAARTELLCRDGVERRGESAVSSPLLEARNLHYRHAVHAAPVLDGLSLSVSWGDRILLEGRSGSGKSTLAAVLAGLRRAQTGLLLLDGLDLATAGFQSWRQRVGAVPQFHENHVLTASFSFNLLMGRRWPPTAEDLHLARAICQELELGPLLERMPSGLGQMLGETGWQLSHGERSRLYVARALLSEPDLLILDESFAALDPVSFAATLACVTERARSLFVIAHP